MNVGVNQSEGWSWRPLNEVQSITAQMNVGVNQSEGVYNVNINGWNI